MPSWRWVGSGKQHTRRCPLTNICHCLNPLPLTFFICCGWYCKNCRGRINRSLEKHLEAARRKREG